MSERLRTALDRLAAALTTTGYPLIEGLRPGLSEAEVRARLAEIGVDPPSDIITLFGWHDGYESPPDSEWHGRICAAYTLLTLDEACQLHVENQEPLELAAAYTGEATEWFTVFATDAGFLVINYGDDPETRGRVAMSDSGDIEPAPDRRPASLADTIELWTSYFGSGQWRWDGESWIDNRPADERAAHPWAI